MNTTKLPKKYFEILEYNHWSLKQKKKAVTSLLASVAGGTCPLEALALIMGRNPKLRKSQMSTVDDINFSLNHADTMLMGFYDMTGRDLKELLFESHVMTVAIRLIAVQNLEPINLEGEDKDTLFQIRFGCIRILVAIVKFKELSNAIWKEQLSNPDLCSVLIKCIRHDSSFVVIIFVLRLLFILLQKYKNSMWFEKYANHLDPNVFATLLHKDHVTSKISKWISNGLSEFEAAVLFSELGTILQSLTLKDFIPTDFLVREVKGAGTKCLIAVHLQTASVILYLYSISAFKKKVQNALQSADILPSLMKWVQVMPLTGEDKNRMWFSFQLLAVSVDNCQFYGKRVIQYPNFIESLELAIRHPDATVVDQCVTLLRVLMESTPTCVKPIIKNQIIVTGLIDNCYSACLSVRKNVIGLLHSTASKHLVTVLTKHGLNPFELVKLQFYYSQSPELAVLLYGMRTEYAKHTNYKVWKKGETTGLKELDPATFTKNIGYISTVKGIGNDFYKRKLYDKAIEMYSAGIEQCPPALIKKFSEDDRKLLAPDYEESDNGWYPLPATLLANRAQCYLHINEYEKAIQDCNRAIVLSNMDNDEGRKICIKAALRRATAFFELDKIAEAFRDMVFCQSHESTEEIKLQYNKAYNKYRSKVGTTFLVKRCVVCLGGEGEKLKRCANCDEIYCSQVCQKDAWASGHKEVCLKTSTMTSSVDAE